MLSDLDPARGIEGESFAVANSSGKAFRWSESLTGTVGVVFPDPGAPLKFGARVNALRARSPIQNLTGIGRGAEID